MIKLTKKIIFKNGTKVEGDETGAVLTDLSKAFNCIGHSLIIGELNACRFKKQSMDIFYFLFLPH